MNDTSGDRVMVALTSAPSQAVAEQMARRLVDERLAACANVVVGVTSIFRWEGEVQREGEVLIILKTTERAVAALERRVVELHPYDVPELVALPVVAGHAPYLDWVGTELAPES
jgi:periplasmic divalent cation tolerance protein